MVNNEIIGRCIGQALGFGIQGYALYQVYNVTPRSFLVARVSIKYGRKVLKYAATNYKRTDFRSEIIFSDAIEALWNVD
jgi:hypothetical protein